MSVKPFLFGPTPSPPLAATLVKQGFGSVNISSRQLPLFGGRAYPTIGVKQAGLDTYMSFWLVNYWNDKTPLIDWFDEPDQNGNHWAAALAQITQAAAAAKALGCVGVSIDTEMYASNGGNASWKWNYSGNKIPQDVTDNMVQLRGQAVAHAIQVGFPGARIIVYLAGSSMLPGLYLDLLDVKDEMAVSSAGLVVLPFFRGFMAGCGGVPVTFLDSTFYNPGSVHAGPFGGEADHGWARSLAATTTGFAKLALGPTAFISPFIWLNGTQATEGSWAYPITGPAFKTFLPQVLAASQNGMYGIFQLDGPFDYTPFAPLGSP